MENTKKYIKIESKGLIDKNAFILMGASTKRDDKSKIGYFGTGLKYAIAYLLRNNIEFKVFSDYDEIEIMTKEVMFEGKIFNQILVDGISTSMTTDMGIDWKDWFVIREIYCNAIDQGEHGIKLTRKVGPIEGKTVFYIEADKFKEVIDNLDKYFSFNRNAIYENKYGKILKPIDKNKTHIYRRGVLVYTIDEKGVYDYDLYNVEINEARTISDKYNMYTCIKELLSVCDNKEVIDLLLYSLDRDSYAESKLGEYYDRQKYNPIWKEVIGNRILVPREISGFWTDIILKNRFNYLILPNAFCVNLKKNFNDLKIIGNTSNLDNSYIELNSTTERQNYLISKALDFLKRAEYDVKFPIQIVSFMRKEVLGMADDDNKRILLSERLFDMGLKNIVATIIEENEHLLTKMEDETREFQNLFIYKFVTALERITGEYL